MSRLGGQGGGGGDVMAKPEKELQRKCSIEKAEKLRRHVLSAWHVLRMGVILPSCLPLPTPHLVPALEPLSPCTRPRCAPPSGRACHWALCGEHR